MIQRSMSTQFEDFANEVFYDVFDYMDTYDIFNSFGDINKRFYKLILSKSKFHCKLFDKSLSKFLFYCENVIPLIKDQLVSLKIERVKERDDIGTFLIYYQLQMFPRLSSLTLKNISEYSLKSIKIDQLVSLKHLSIVFFAS
ncbi:unnamed protein product, partial [Didymodactylos carnosus]